MSEATAVEAHFSATGEITPRRFRWRGDMLLVESVGRRWRAEGGYCFTIMAAGGRLFELRMDEETLCWRVVRGPMPRPVV